MNGSRGPLIAVVLALALGLVYWGWVMKLQPERARAAEDAKLLFKGLDPAGTGEILLRKTGSDDVLLRKVEGQWRLITPVAAPADPDAVGALVTELGAAKRDDIVVDKGADLRDFGLDKPSGEVTFKPATPGAKAQVLFFGINSPEGNQAYGMVEGRPEVFLTDLYVKDSILKTAADLRDKTVWTFSPADVEAVRSSGGGFSVTRDKQGFWQVAAGARREPAKASAMDAWLAGLARLRADSVPSETGGGDFGLARAKTLTLTLKNGAVLALREGKARPKPAGGVFVQVSGQGPVFALPAYAASQLDKKAADLMDLQALGFDASAVTRFEVRRPKGTLNAVKTAGSWSWTPPSPSKPGAKPFDFQGFLSALSDTRLLKRLKPADRPLTPTATVSLYGADGSLLEKAVFGGLRGEGQVLAGYTKNQVVLVPVNLLDGLPPDAAAPPPAKP